MTQDLKPIVEEVLSQDLDSRNGDKYLIYNVLKKLGVKELTTADQSKQLQISLDQLESLPSFESITRLRRKIQNDEKRYLPTYAKVLHSRGFSEDTVRAVFGDHSNILGRYIFIASEGAYRK